jgi:guanylate kinase
MADGPLFVVSGPSGSGKSTVIHSLLRRGVLPLHLAVSATTRPPRPGEVDGVHYHFWSPERFASELARGTFLEHATIHGKYSYGTPRNEVIDFRQRGIGVILDIDVQGFSQVRLLFPELVSIFIRLPSDELYEQRIRERGSESEEEIARRLATARYELSRIAEYQYVIVNDQLERAVDELQEILSRYFP